MAAAASVAPGNEAHLHTTFVPNLYLIIQNKVKPVISLRYEKELKIREQKHVPGGIGDIGEGGLSSSANSLELILSST